jgi:hypothetical protein
MRMAATKGRAAFRKNILEVEYSFTSQQILALIIIRSG